MRKPKDTPRMEISQEVRFALVMYGGWAQAIYIGGVTKELFHMVQATAVSPDDNVAFLPDGELHGTERVYRKLGQILDWKSVSLQDLRDTTPDQPIRTRFMVSHLSSLLASSSCQCTGHASLSCDTFSD